MFCTNDLLEVKLQAKQTKLQDLILFISKRISVISIVAGMSEMLLVLNLTKTTIFIDIEIINNFVKIKLERNCYIHLLSILI